jgi:hypothetical protein
MFTLVALTLIGRHEEAVWQRKENRGIAGVRHLVGARLAHPDGFRSSPQFACLEYRHGKYLLYGQELCFDTKGAIVEAIIRRPNLNPEIWTLRMEPAAAKVRVNPEYVAHLLDLLGAQIGTAIVVGGLDIGPRGPPLTP